jgi:hypothetical protein
LRPGTSSSSSLQFTSDGDGSLISRERKGTPAAKTSFVSKKSAEKSEEGRLFKKTGLAITSGKKLHLSKSSSSSNKKEPTARSGMPPKTRLIVMAEPANKSGGSLYKGREE